MSLHTGGRASGATSTRSRSASSARRRASSTRTTPTCSPLGPTRRTSGTRIRSLIRGSLMAVPHSRVAEDRWNGGRPPSLHRSEASNEHGAPPGQGRGATAKGLRPRTNPVPCWDQGGISPLVRRGRAPAGRIRRLPAPAPQPKAAGATTPVTPPTSAGPGFGPIPQARRPGRHRRIRGAKRRSVPGGAGHRWLPPSLMPQATTPVLTTAWITRSNGFGPAPAASSAVGRLTSRAAS